MDVMYAPPTQDDNNKKQLPAGTGLAVAILVLGIISIITCNNFFTGIVALILYLVNKAKFTDPEIKGMAKAGFICSIVGIGIQALYFIGVMLYMLFIFGIAFASI